MKTEINFEYLVDFRLENEAQYRKWLGECASFYNKHVSKLSYVFCSDDYLLEINKSFLNHDYFTDIITFDDCKGNRIYGDIIISVDRVKENADLFEVDFRTELKRVMAHGLLHLLGYKDASDDEKRTMRRKEVEFIKLFHVEH